MRTPSSTTAQQPYEKKGFKAALNVFLSQQVPQLGGELTRQPVVEHITAMVEEYYPSTERMKMGQMLWFAIDKNETAGYGKSLDKCKQQPVILDVLHETDVEDILQGVKKRKRQQKVAVRLFDQAYEQNGVLTLADVGAILRLSPSTVSRYVVEFEKETSKVVPRRGTIHDMGPTLTHKKVICKKLFNEGKSVEQTAQETNHSTAAVVRYGNDFRRVRECMKANWDIPRISFATGISKSVTEQYVEMLVGNEVPF